MLSRKPLSKAGTALIGIIALLISPMAWSVIDLDEDDGGVTFAKETLVAEVEGSDGYYVVNNEAGALNMAGRVGVGGTRDLFVDFTLAGMVFAAPPGLALTDDADECATATVNTAISLRGGGARGDTLVSFILGGTPPRTPDSIACLVIAENGLGISPDMSGSVALDTEDDVSSRPLSHSSSFSGAVSVAKGLMPSGENINPTATVASAS